MRCFSIYLFFLCTFSAYAQPGKPVAPDWHYLDYKTDGYLGISLKQAYDQLKNKKVCP
ncbi:hypothetical protein LWM68_46295 [Niabella sp. W65]|nr:hypothetical protein [Niabella sp. W65]MCH7369491.1 hypothetical protein [Niabella sp. W65]